MIWGGAKRMGGGKRTRQSALPKIFGPLPKELLVRSVVDFCTGKNRALTPEEGGKRTVRGGPKPLFGRGVIREVFHPPLFSTPHGYDLASWPRHCKESSRRKNQKTREGCGCTRVKWVPFVLLAFLSRVL